MTSAKKPPKSRSTKKSAKYHSNSPKISTKKSIKKSKLVKSTESSNSCEVKSCKISNKPFFCLVKKCANNTICVKRSCKDIKTKISSGVNGDVYVLNDLVAKTNKPNESLYFSDINSEIIHQQKAYEAGLAPKIEEFYYDKSSDSYIIVMENLMMQNYVLLDDYINKKKVNVAFIRDFFNTVDRLHSIGISHRDLHSRNIFYNKSKNDFKFIDFGFAIQNKTKQLAVLNEKWAYMDFIDFILNSTTLKEFGPYMIQIPTTNLHVTSIYLQKYFDNDFEKVRQFIGKIQVLIQSDDITYVDRTVDEINKYILHNGPHTTAVKKHKLKSIDEKSSITDILIYQNIPAL